MARPRIFKISTSRVLKTEEHPRNQPLMDSPSGGSRSTGKISKIDEQSDANTENVLLPMAYARPGPASSAELPPVRNTFIFGILNITDDSFSDAGKFLDPKV